MNFFKSRKHQITVVAAVVLILSWLAIPENVKASQSYFPFITDDWIVCDIQIDYYGAAEPPVRCGESHLSGLTEPPRFFII